MPQYSVEWPCQDLPSGVTAYSGRFVALRDPGHEQYTQGGIDGAVRGILDKSQCQRQNP